MVFLTTKVLFFCFISLSFNILNAENLNSVNCQILTNILIINKRFNISLSQFFSTTHIDDSVSLLPIAKKGLAMFHFDLLR
jgi:hypothetical protein